MAFESKYTAEPAYVVIWPSFAVTQLSNSCWNLSQDNNQKNAHRLTKPDKTTINILEECWLIKAKRSILPWMTALNRHKRNITGPSVNWYKMTLKQTYKHGHSFMSNYIWAPKSCGNYKNAPSSKFIKLKTFHAKFCLYFNFTCHK